MMGFIIAIHVIVCALLIVIILIQRGRGSGLVESFSGVESMFGTKTNTFLTRTTTVLSTLFLLTCLTLAILSARQSRSLMRNIKPAQQQALPESPKPETAKTEAPKAEATTQETPTQNTPKPAAPPTE
jgi:preprotein translocase subunit SecG